MEKNWKETIKEKWQEFKKHPVRDTICGLFGVVAAAGMFCIVAGMALFLFPLLGGRYKC